MVSTDETRCGIENVAVFIGFFGGGLFELEEELLVVVFFVGLFLAGVFLEELVVFFEFPLFDLLGEVSDPFFLLLFETID